MTAPSPPKVQKLIYEKDRPDHIGGTPPVVVPETPPDQVLHVAGSLADRTYVTWNVDPDNPPNVILNMWRTGTSDSTLLSSVDIGAFLVSYCRENDSGTVGIYGTNGDGYQIVRPYIDGGDLAFNVIEVGPYDVWDFCASMDGAEFAVQVQRTYYVTGPGGGSVSVFEQKVYGYAVTGAQNWVIEQPVIEQGYLAGAPSAGKIIWVNDESKWFTETQYGTLLSQTVTTYDGYGSPEWDLVFSWTFPDLLWDQYILDKDFGSFRFCYAVYDYPPSYNPPWPETGGVATWGSQTIDSNISSQRFAQSFAPSGYPQYFGEVGVTPYKPSGIDYSSIPDDGSFSLTFHTTPPYTGGVANNGWAGYVPNPYGYPLPWTWGYMYPFLSQPPILMDIGNTHSKEIQLLDSDGTILSYLPLEGAPYSIDIHGFPINWNYPTSPGGNYWDKSTLLGCGDAYVLYEWGRLTWAGDVLAIHPWPGPGSYPTNTGNKVTVAAWNGQVALVTWDNYIYGGG